MVENYGALWTSQYSDIPNYGNSRSWVMALSGLTGSQIRSGINEVFNQMLEYPPKPLQFRALCLKSNDKDKELIYRQTLNWNNVDHEDRRQEALFIIRNMEDFQEFRTAPTNRARAIFDAEYQKMLDHVNSGGELPEILIEIENKTSQEKRPLDLSGLIRGIG